MSANPLRDLASAARDIRTIGMRRVPINIERACMIFINQFAFHSTASILSAIKIAKFAKWANMEVYYIVDPNVNEVEECLTHFTTQVTQVSFIYFSGNPISQDTMDGKAAIKVSNGTIGPNLIYSTIDQKNEDLQLILCIDGINRPEAWNPLDQDLETPHTTIIAPYPDPDQAHLQQLDLKNQTIFINEFWESIKVKPMATLKEIASKINPELVFFGQKLFAVSFPETDAEERKLIF